MNIKSKLFTTTLIIATFASCIDKDNSHSEWKLIYKTNAEGQPIFGDKKELISITRKGYPIRIGWTSRRRSDTTKSVEHTVDGEFLTIANGKEVFVQIQPFLAQKPDLTSDTLSMTLLPLQSHWVLGTNGMISSVSVDFSKNTAKAYPPSPFRYAMSWFAYIPNDSE
ncbi:hypothetical protein [Flagellimonas lutimaris]|nr:hypothetical protein [Allomuricauda lutimaris]